MFTPRPNKCQTIYDFQPSRNRWTKLHGTQVHYLNIIGLFFFSAPPAVGRSGTSSNRIRKTHARQVAELSLLLAEKISNDKSASHHSSVQPLYEPCPYQRERSRAASGPRQRAKTMPKCLNKAHPGTYFDVRPAVDRQPGYRRVDS